MVLLWCRLARLVGVFSCIDPHYLGGVCPCCHQTHLPSSVPLQEAEEGEGGDGAGAEDQDEGQNVAF